MSDPSKPEFVSRGEPARKRKTYLRWIVVLVVIAPILAVAIGIAVKGERIGAQTSSSDGGYAKVTEKITPEQATQMINEAIGKFHADIDAQNDPALKRDVLLRDFCQKVAAWSDVTVMNQPGTDRDAIEHPFVNLTNAAAEMYRTVAAQFQQEYGTSRSLPGFENSYPLQCQR